MSANMIRFVFVIQKRQTRTAIVSLGIN